MNKTRKLSIGDRRAQFDLFGGATEPFTPNDVSPACEAAENVNEATTNASAMQATTRPSSDLASITLESVSAATSRETDAAHATIQAGTAATKPGARLTLRARLGQHLLSNKPANDNLEAPRAAIYARTSQKSQKLNAETGRPTNYNSPENQVRACEQYADLVGMSVRVRGMDLYKSGKSMFGRDGLAEVLAAIRAGEIDTLIVCELGRLTRDFADAGLIWDILQDNSTKLHIPGMGAIDKGTFMSGAVAADVGINHIGTMTRLALKDNTLKGIVNAPPCYGYRLMPGVPGDRVIHEGEAMVIRWITVQFLNGVPVIEICRQLNRKVEEEKVRLEKGATEAAFWARPEGGLWNPTCVVGTERKPGILRQPLITGLTVSGRTISQLRREGGRKVEEVPEDKWVIGKVSHLAIIGEDAWDAVQQKLDDRRHTGARSKSGPPAPLSAQITCSCGGTMLSMGGKPTYLVCRHAHLKDGHCSRRPVRKDVILDMVHRHAKSVLADAQFVDTALKALQATLADDLKLHSAAVDKAQAARDKVRKDHRSLMDHYTDLVISNVDTEPNFTASLKQRIADMRNELQTCEDAVVAAKGALHLFEGSEKKEALLEEAIATLKNELGPDSVAGIFSPTASQALGMVIDKVVLHHDNDNGELRIVSQGLLPFDETIPLPRRGRPRMKAA